MSTAKKFPPEASLDRALAPDDIPVKRPSGHAPRRHGPAHRDLRHIDLDDGDAFVADFRRGFVPVKDGDAEAFGEEFIAAATSGEASGEDARDELRDEEMMEGLTIEMPLVDDTGE